VCDERCRGGGHHHGHGAGHGHGHDHRDAHPQTHTHEPTRPAGDADSARAAGSRPQRGARQPARRPSPKSPRRGGTR
jgi:hypothetical protein